jgi:hypothetical protein
MGEIGISNIAILHIFMDGDLRYTSVARRQVQRKVGNSSYYWRLVGATPLDMTWPMVVPSAACTREADDLADILVDRGGVAAPE